MTSVNAITAPKSSAERRDSDAPTESDGKAEEIELNESTSTEDGRSSARASGGGNTSTTGLDTDGGVVQYRLYKRRFVGVVCLFVLNVFAGMCWPWFGPISNNMVAEFGVTLDQVNWLGNIMALVYLPVSIGIPYVLSRTSLRTVFITGGACLLISAWVRYAGTAHSLSTNGAYALLVVGQLFAAIAQPIYQVLPPKYSEVWFDLKGRTTATMILSIANPIGGALGQLISPLIGSSRQSILVLGVMCTIAAPFSLLVQSKPPTPPTYAGSKTSPPLTDTLQALFGRSPNPAAYMAPRERVDFAIMILIFGVLVGSVNTFSVISGELLEPYGYSDDITGLMGAALLLSGIVAAVITSPLFDRVLTHHLGITTRILCPILAAAWFSTIWVIKPDNTGALFAVLVIVGISGITMLPVSMELGCELTRNADGSSALLWCAGNLFGVIFILVEGALRAGPGASPPLNMHRGIVFNAAFVCSAVAFIVFFRGKQARKEMDEQKNREGRTLP